MRFRNFMMFQRAAFRALFRRRTRLLELPYAFELPPPVMCRCYEPHVSQNLLWLAHADHEPGCPWAEAMCKVCGGTGWCEHCGGDGTEPRG